MTNGEQFERFGDPRSFAVELRLEPDPDPPAQVPASSLNSWGAWRLWVSGLNLCEIEFTTTDGVKRADCVRWYLAPLFRWFSAEWNALLHESRLPAGGPVVDVRPRNARATYLGQLRKIGDEDRFEPWQTWASRHSLRTCAEGGIVPDVFFQRVGDEIEVSWGDRIAPGGEAAAFVLEDGVARADVSAVAAAVDAALNWFVAQPTFKPSPWISSLRASERKRRAPAPEERLAWFLDGEPRQGALSSTLLQLSGSARAWLSAEGARTWLAPLAPQVAMFGALSPLIDRRAAQELLDVLADAVGEPSAALETLCEIDPAWTAPSPWDEGYQLARDVLEEADPSPSAEWTDVDRMATTLGAEIEEKHLGPAGPRGVAIAGPGYRPTIVVNPDHDNNKNERGTRFTVAHELCHLLFDRDRARSIIHTSTPWAHPSVEQRANAFAAMLLMPPKRLQWPAVHLPLEALTTHIEEAVERLRIGRTALIWHLANLGYINETERDVLQSSPTDDERKAGRSRQHGSRNRRPTRPGHRGSKRDRA